MYRLNRASRSSTRTWSRQASAGYWPISRVLTRRPRGRQTARVWSRPSPYRAAHRFIGWQRTGVPPNGLRAPVALIPNRAFHPMARNCIL